MIKASQQSPFERSIRCSSDEPPNDRFVVSRIDVYIYSYAKWGFAVDLSLLDETEQSRYERFRDSAGQCFAQTRTLLKTLLAERLTCHPSAVQLDISANGKPSLNSQLQSEQSRPLHFSLAHSNASIVIAIAQQNLGVDIDSIARRGQPYLLANRLINPYVGAQVNQDIQHGEQIFSHYWCAMEAYVKHKGTGIAVERKEFKPNLCCCHGADSPASVLDRADNPKPMSQCIDVYNNVNLLRRALLEDGVAREMIALAYTDIDTPIHWYQWGGKGFVDEQF